MGSISTIISLFELYQLLSQFSWSPWMAAGLPCGARPLSAVGSVLRFRGQSYAFRVRLSARDRWQRRRCACVRSPAASRGSMRTCAWTPVL